MVDICLPYSNPCYSHLLTILQIFGICCLWRHPILSSSNGGKCVVFTPLYAIVKYMYLQAVYWYGIEQGNFQAADHDEIDYATFSLTRLPRFFGVAVYLLCVHSMVR